MGGRGVRRSPPGSIQNISEVEHSHFEHLQGFITYYNRRPIVNCQNINRMQIPSK